MFADVRTDDRNEHQDFFGKNPAHPYCQVVINPKLEKVKREYGERVR